MQGNNNPLTLGTESVKKLLLRYAIPSIVAMLSSSLYNMIDSIFIGHGVGAMAISGLAITMPIMNVIAALGTLVSVGGATLMSVKMGQGDKKSAEYILSNVLMLNVIIGLCLTAAGVIFLDDILYFFGASENTIPYAREFMHIILSGTAVTHVYLGLNDMLRASGYPGKAMGVILTAIAINCVLNPLFIFGFKWGIAGSAFATVIAQTVAMSIELVHFMRNKHFIHFERKMFGLKAHIVKGIFSIGVSPFLMNICASIVVIFINKSLMTYGGDFYVGAYGIINRVLMVFIMIVIGLNQGMQPIVGYNFGARKFDRVARALRYAIFAAVAVTTSGFLMAEIFPHLLANMFTGDQELIDIASHGMRIVLIMFPIVGFQMVTANFFQSIGKVRKAILLSLTRQMLFLVPLLIILPRFMGTLGVWISMPIADSLATVLAVFLLTRQMKKFRENNDNDNNLKTKLI
ncbi:MAG: MATE family efflux transporter [Flavobacteriales bacterium]|jgi:MATE efflux family protein|nr:MAG: MATE family efflux transporter [Flavobacteriales bacterium]